jgi:hypothetical protein
MAEAGSLLKWAWSLMAEASSLLRWAESKLPQAMSNGLAPGE